MRMFWNSILACAAAILTAAAPMAGDAPKPAPAMERGVEPIPAPPQGPAIVEQQAPKYTQLALSLMPASAKLAVAVDVRALRTSKALEVLWNRFFDMPNIQAGAAKMQEAFEFDVRRDLDFVAVSVDPNVKHSEFILLEGRFKTARVQEVLLAMGIAPDVRNGITVYMLPDEKEPGKVNYGTFLKPDLIAFGNKEAVLAAIDRLREGGEPKVTCPAAAMIQALPANAPVRAGLNEISKLPDIDDAFRPYLKSAVGSLEVTDQVLLKLSAQCRDDMVAKDVKELAEGGVALAKLALAKKPELQKMLKEALDSARFEQAGAAVNGEAKMASAKAAASVTQLLDKEERKQKNGNPTAEQVGTPEKGDF